VDQALAKDKDEDAWEATAPAVRADYVFAHNAAQKPLILSANLASG